MSIGGIVYGMGWMLVELYLLDTMGPAEFKSETM